MHQLFADAIEELLGQAAAAAQGASQPSAAVDTWMLVTDIVTEPYRDNAFGARGPSVLISDDPGSSYGFARTVA